LENDQKPTPRAKRLFNKRLNALRRNEKNTHAERKVIENDQGEKKKSDGCKEGNMGTCWHEKTKGNRKTQGKTAVGKVSGDKKIGKNPP